nr:LptF/LptG family permease [Pirellula sp.]
NGRKWHTFAETFELPLVQASKAGSVEGSASTYSMFDIPDELKRLYEKNERRKEQLATEMSFHLGTGRYVSLQDPKIQQIKGEVKENEDRMSRLRSEPMRRWALGFGCLAFVWIGVPMAILLKNADYWWTFGLCFIPILLIYYPILGLSLEMTKKGAWPSISLWLANLVLIAIGAWFLRRIVKQ